MWRPPSPGQLSQRTFLVWSLSVAWLGGYAGCAHRGVRIASGPIAHGNGELGGYFLELAAAQLDYNVIVDTKPNPNRTVSFAAKSTGSGGVVVLRSEADTHYEGSDIYEVDRTGRLRRYQVASQNLGYERTLNMAALSATTLQVSRSSHGRQTQDAEPVEYQSTVSVEEDVVPTAFLPMLVAQLDWSRQPRRRIGVLDRDGTASSVELTYLGPMKVVWVGRTLLAERVRVAGPGYNRTWIAITWGGVMLESRAEDGDVLLRLQQRRSLDEIIRSLQ